VPTLVTENVGTVGACVSGGSATVTVLLCDDRFRAASTAYTRNE
jgi:hypothetical protein